jgi:hypothetical protein
MSIPEDTEGYDTAEKTFWSCSKFLCVSNRIEIRFKSFSTPIDQYLPGCETLSQPVAWRTMQYTKRVNAVLHCGSMRLKLGQCGYNRANTDINTELKSVLKFWTWPKIFLNRIVLPEYIRNWHGLRCRSIRVEPGQNGFNSVWTRFEIRPCVTVFLEYRPHSKLFWSVLTCLDLHLIPVSQIQRFHLRLGYDALAACFRNFGGWPCGATTAAAL